jgi:hypothetical protein
VSRSHETFFAHKRWHVADDPSAVRNTEEDQMLEPILLIGALGFFALTVWYAYACERL